MKKGFKFALILAMLSMPVVCSAQSEDMVKNKALSAQYKSDITIEKGRGHKCVNTFHV